jgi:hypothetical protein
LAARLGRRRCEEEAAIDRAPSSRRLAADLIVGFWAVTPIGLRPERDAA